MNTQRLDKQQIEALARQTAKDFPGGDLERLKQWIRHIELPRNPWKLGREGK